MRAEARGIALALAVAGAKRSDFKMVRDTLESLALARALRRVRRGARQEGMCLDAGYDYEEVGALVGR